jgi:hypothetical protein
MRVIPRTLPLATVLVGLVAFPAGAAAAPRHVASGDAATSGDCPAEAPCTLEHAVASAVAGDEIVVAAGEYQLDAPVVLPAGVSIAGAAGERARLRATPRNTGGAVVAGPGASVRHLSLRSKAAGQAALTFTGGTAEDLELVAEGGSAAVLTRSADTTVLRDSVLRTVSNGSRALQLLDGSGAGAIEVRNLTVWSSGSSSVGIWTEAAPGSATVQNTIVRAHAADVGGTPTGSVGLRNSNFRPFLATGAVDLGGNQSGAPVFLDEVNGNFRPAAGSPTIDAGVADAFTGAADPDGVARATPDIGAYEYDPARVPAGPGSGGDGDGDGDGGNGRKPKTGDGLPTPTANPRQGKSLNAEPGPGKVKIKLPGATATTTLTEPAAIPVGSTVDVRGGTIRLVSAADKAGTPQWADFSGAVFTVTQKPGTPVTDLVVGGFDPRSCTAKRGTARTAGARSSRLWGRGKGRWRSRGRRGSASVRGTIWMTEDNCSGTAFRVKEGKVLVRDFVTGRNLFLTAGGRYLARTRARR